MCVAIPAKIASIDKNAIATVDIMGVTRQVALDLVPHAQAGDYVLVHAGYGIELVNEQYAKETLELIAQFPELINEDHPGMGRRTDIEAPDTKATAAQDKQTQEQTNSSDAETSAPLDTETQ